MRWKQLRSFESFTEFQQRILCHRLPKSFDDIDPKHDGNKLRKHRQECKRRLLTIEFEKHEMELRVNAHAYELEWNQARLSVHRHDNEAALQCIQDYLTQFTNREIRTIRFNESRLHTKLTRRRLLSITRAAATTTTTTINAIDVYPRVIIDTGKVLLNRTQLDYLSHNGESDESSSSSTVDRVRMCSFLLSRTKLHSTESELPLFA